MTMTPVQKLPDGFANVILDLAISTMTLLLAIRLAISGVARSQEQVLR